MDEDLMTPKARPSIYENPNGFPLSHGKTLHMECGINDLANRIITVGSLERAEVIAKNLFNTHVITSHRGFTTITGTYNGQRVSLVSIGMGPAMMDFFVRESRAVVDGPMVIVRFGTCGGIAKDATAGSIVVATEGSGFVDRNPDYFLSSDEERVENNLKPYYMHKIFPTNEVLNNLIIQHLEQSIGPNQVKKGVNITADSFYSSQGRIDSNFDDGNDGLIQEILDRYPNAMNMEMESYVLFHLAHCSKKPIYVSAACIIVANRKSTSVIDNETLKELEKIGGEAILKAIVEYPL